MTTNSSISSFNTRFDSVEVYSYKSPWTLALTSRSSSSPVIRIDMRKSPDLANTSHNQIKQHQNFIPYNGQRESTLTPTTEHQTPTSLSQPQNSTDFGENWCAAPEKGQIIKKHRQCLYDGCSVYANGAYVWSVLAMAETLSVDFATRASGVQGHHRSCLRSHGDHVAFPLVPKRTRKTMLMTSQKSISTNTTH